MNKVTFEPLRSAHLKAVMAIEEELFPTAWTEEMFRQEIEANDLSQSFAVVYESEIIGYVVTWHVHDEVHLLNVGVTGAYQRKGIGATIMQYVVDEAMRLQRRLVTLEVRAGNDVARRLYEKFGFKPVMVRKNYYVDEQEDAVVMVYLVNNDEDDHGKN